MWGLYGLRRWSEVRPFRCYCGSSKCIYNILNNRPRKRGWRW